MSCDSQWKSVEGLLQRCVIIIYNALQNSNSEGLPVTYTDSLTYIVTCQSETNPRGNPTSRMRFGPGIILMNMI